MPWGAAIVAAGAIGGALISSNASDNASKAQQQSAAAANSEQQREYDLARADYAPYRASGEAALNKLNGLMANPSSVTSDPSISWEMGQGTQAVDRSAAGAGSLYSGATLKALQRYGQDYAGTKLNEAYNRYANVAGLGQVATNGTTNAGTNAANQIGNNLTGAGSVAAANYLNQGNAYGNALNQLSSYAKTKPWSSTSTNDLNGNGYGGYGASGTDGAQQYGDGYGPW